MLLVLGGRRMSAFGSILMLATSIVDNLGA
jgi:hypothetical protein